MAWAATTTFTTGQVVTAAQMNVISGDLDALNTRLNNTATVATSEGRANGAYGDLATVGPTVSSLTTGTFALVILSAKMSENTNAGEANMSVDVSGATTTAASDANALRFQFPTAANAGIRCSVVVPLTLTAGSNTFKAKYRSSGGDTATFADRQLTVIPVF
jgi:hypothetical protein